MDINLPNAAILRSVFCFWVMGTARNSGTLTGVFVGLLGGQYNAIRLAGCVRISFICSCSLSEPKNKTFAYEILVVGEKGEQQLSEKEGRGGTIVVVI